MNIGDRSRLEVIRERGMREIVALAERNRVFSDACNTYYASRKVAERFENLNQEYWVQSWGNRRSPAAVEPANSMDASASRLLGSVRLVAGKHFTDTDCNIRPEHREHAIARIMVIAGSRSAAEAIVGDAGWR